MWVHFWGKQRGPSSEAQSRTRRAHRKFFFFFAPVSAFDGAGQQGQAGGNGDRMMWIWYLLLGSGSGSQTVGEYLKRAGTKVTGLGLLLLLLLLSRSRSAPLHGRLGRRGGHVKFFEVWRLCCKFFVLLLDEFKLIGRLHGRALLTFRFHRVWAYFLAANRKLREPSFWRFFFFSFFFSESVESIPHGACPPLLSRGGWGAQARTRRRIRQPRLPWGWGSTLFQVKLWARGCWQGGVDMSIRLLGPAMAAGAGGGRRNVSLHGTPSWWGVHRMKH